MTYHYDPRTPILGTTLGTYREVLLAWEREEDLAVMPARLGVSPDAMALVVDDAEARGLFGVADGEYGATPAGKEFLKGVTTRRMTNAQARELLDGLLDKATALNADRRNPLMVERVWLFGSLAQGLPDCGDVDIVVERTPSHETTKPHRDYDRRIVQLAYDMGGGLKVAASEFKRWAAEDHVLGRSLYGERRDPRIVDHALWDLQALGCPCKVVFDRRCGGRVNGPLLDRHPESRVAAAGRPVRGVVPDMAAPSPPDPCAIHLAVERARMALDLDLLDRGPIGRPTHWSTPKDALARWVSTLPDADGRAFSIVEDEEAFSYAGGKLAGEAHVALGIARALEPGRGPVLDLSHAESLCGREPKTEQVMRLGSVLAHACMLDAGKMDRLGLLPAQGHTVTLTTQPGLPDWAGLALGVAQAHLRRWGHVVEASVPAPALVPA